MGAARLEDWLLESCSRADPGLTPLGAGNNSQGGPGRAAGKKRGRSAEKGIDNMWVWSDQSRGQDRAEVWLERHIVAATHLTYLAAYTLYTRYVLFTFNLVLFAPLSLL